MTDTVARLQSVDSTALSDALDRLGRDGVVVGLEPLRVPARLVGRAVTVSIGSTPGARAARHFATAAIEQAGPGDVIVVAHPGPPDVAGWGGNLHLAASVSGISGVVVDGAVRDADEIRSLEPPVVFARGVTPRSSRGRLREESWNEPVLIGGIAVRPGDLVLGDGSGVVFVPAEIFEEALASALEIVATEEELARRIRAGEPISSVLGSAYEGQLRGDRE